MFPGGVRAHASWNQLQGCRQRLQATYPAPEDLLPIVSDLNGTLVSLEGGLRVTINSSLSLVPHMDSLNPVLSLSSWCPLVRAPHPQHLVVRRSSTLLAVAQPLGCRLCLVLTSVSRCPAADRQPAGTGLMSCCSFL